MAIGPPWTGSGAPPARGWHARCRIIFALAESVTTVVLAIGDDGPGIPPDDRTRVFDRFVRLNSARARDAGGAGLGLAIVATIIERHHGTIAIHTTDGGGAILEARIPKPTPQASAHRTVVVGCFNGHMLMAAPRSEARGARFNAAMAVAVRHLPGRLSEIVPPNLVGFILINGLTFGIDLVLLTALHSVLRVPLWLSITIAYSCAFGLAYVLNRTFNFRSHAAVGRQVAVYAAVVVINYVVWILGVGAGTAALGLEYHVARVLAGACEAIYMYCALRWIVFRRQSTAPSATA